MALTSIAVPALKLQHSAAPGRPAAPAERLLVPGTPQAEANRPVDAPGRIPITSDEGESEPLALIEDIDRRVRESAEYQAIKPFLKQVGLGRDEEAPEKEHESRAKTEATALPLPAAAPPRRAAAPQGDGETVRRADPLALDLDGNGLQTSGVAQGVLFDIDADGRLDRTSFVTGGDAFLALDRNGNGRIDDGRELFGDQNGDANGYQALARYDDNGDGRIDAGDAVFSRLRLFRIGDDGSQQLQGLQSAGVSAIGLDYSETQRALNRYDTIAQQGSFERSDGSRGESGDLLLGFSTLA
jgi:hypothetical protein